MTQLVLKAPTPPLLPVPRDGLPGLDQTLTSFRRDYYTETSVLHSLFDLNRSIPSPFPFVLFVSLVVDDPETPSLPQPHSPLP